MLQPVTLSCRVVTAGQSLNFTDDLTRQAGVFFYYLILPEEIMILCTKKIRHSDLCKLSSYCLTRWKIFFLNHNDAVIKYEMSVTSNARTLTYFNQENNFSETCINLHSNSMHNDHKVMGVYINLCLCITSQYTWYPLFVQLLYECLERTVEKQNEKLCFHLHVLIIDCVLIWWC